MRLLKDVLIYAVAAAFGVAVYFGIDASADAIICLPKHLEIGICFNEMP